MLICLKLENIHLQILREICSIYLEVNAGICFFFFALMAHSNIIQIMCSFCLI